MFQRSKIIASSLALCSLAHAADYCTFYTDSACTQNANDVSYEVGNLGCIAPKGDYIYCKDSLYKKSTVTIYSYPEPACPANAYTGYSIPENTCYDFAGSPAHVPDGSYQIVSTIAVSRRETPAERRNVTARDNVYTCDINLQTFDSTDCSGAEQSTQVTITANTKGTIDPKSGCYVNDFARSFVYQSGYICDVYFFDNEDCSGDGTPRSPPAGVCEATTLMGLGNPGSFYLQCPCDDDV